MAKSDRKTIKAFVAHLAEHGHPGLTVDRWPEDDNRSAPEIDAIADDFAVEHTSVDTVREQRRDADWFTAVFDPIVNAVAGALASRVRITVPYPGVSRGQNSAAIQREFVAWINCSVSSLPDGSRRLRIPGVPFEFTVTKESDRAPGLIFNRELPDEPAAPGRIREQLATKSDKLLPYFQKGYRTVLLVESIDPSLMNQGKMLELLKEALGELPLSVACLWYVEAPRSMRAEFFDFTDELQSNS